MKTDKEYPATHSMSTAWYVADEDGNVAIMDYNDNGPVPWETEQTCIENLIYGHDEYMQKDGCIRINLTEEQIDDLMENPHQPEDEDLWFDCIFQIDLEQEEDFLKLAKNPDVEISLCIDKKRGLYDVDCFDCTVKRGHKYEVLETSSLKQMIERGMIKQIFKAKDFFISDDWEDNKVVFTHQFSSAPYYIYAQPYWNELLAERINIPTNPVKLNQIPPTLRKRIPRVPIKFSETEKFQIAEWHPCCIYGDDKVCINGFVYVPIVLTDGSKAYVYTTQGGINFFDYCSEKTKWRCKECSSACCTIHGNEYSNRPTVMFVFHPYKDYDYEMTIKSDEIIRHAIRIPLLHKIPYKHPQGYYMFKDDTMKHVSKDKLKDLFIKNRQHFEDTVLRFNPQVIIVEQEAKDLLKKDLIDEKHIKIKDCIYPCFINTELEEYREEITKLALLPYRGIEMPYLISGEEIENYKKKKT